MLKKLLIGTFMVFFIPFLIANVLIYHLNYSESMAKTVKTNEELLRVGIYSLEGYLNELKNIAVSVYVNPDIKELLNKKDAYTDTERYILMGNLTAMLNQEGSIRRIGISGKNGEVMTQESIGLDNDKVWRTVLPDNSKSGFYAGVSEEGTPIAFNYTEHLKAIPDTEVMANIYFYCVTDRLADISKSIMGENADESVVSFYYGSMEKAIYANHTYENPSYETYEEGYATGTLDGKAGYFFIGEDTFQGQTLRIFNFVPQSVILAPINKMISRLIMIQFIVLLGGALFIWFLNKNMIRPVRNIARNIDKVEAGEYKYEATYDGNDEIGILDHKYEEMVAQINVLVNKDLKNALEISKTQLKMLQAQINPHFLNNMLQTISTQALKQGARDVSVSLSKLARIFQYNMDTSQDQVALYEELKQITNYLDLQKERYRERLQYRIDYDPDLKNIIIPKMILQPLLENSLKHGIERMEAPGIIAVLITKKKCIRIEIMDNGVGFSPEKIQELKSGYKNYIITPNAGHGIGFLNVLQRMQLCYENFNWDIKSIPFQETCVILEIPLEVKADEDSVCR